MITLNAKIPEGPLAEKWTRYKSGSKLVNPANKKKLDIIIIGLQTVGCRSCLITG